MRIPNSIRRALAAALAVLTLLPMAVSADGTAFSDVPEDHPFYAAVMDCAAKGITSGYADGTFKSANSVTKAQFCVMLARAFYPGEVEALSTDENKAVAWYNPSVLALKNAGVLKDLAFADFTDDLTIMGQAIPRYQMAQLMTNIMAAKGFSATEAQKAEAQGNIADYSALMTKSQDAVKNVFALGIITGYSDGTFKPLETMNRGQGCVVIYRMAQYTPTVSSPVTTAQPEAPAPESETPATPVQPETPAGRTLSNGKPITEDNVIELLRELNAKYPDGTNFRAGYVDANSRGDVEKALGNRTAHNLKFDKIGQINLRLGCGGWAALVSDYIFGKTGAPMRKIDFMKAHPGDIVVTVLPNGEVYHLEAITSRLYHDDDMGAWVAKTTGASTTIPGDISSYIINWPDNAFEGGEGGGVAAVYDDGYGADNFEVWTRYPD